MRKRSQTKNTNEDSQKKTRVIKPLNDKDLKNITGGYTDPEGLAIDPSTGNM